MEPRRWNPLAICLTFPSRQKWRTRRRRRRKEEQATLRWNPPAQVPSGQKCAEPQSPQLLPAWVEEGEGEEEEEPEGRRRSPRLEGAPAMAVSPVVVHPAITPPPPDPAAANLEQVAPRQEGGEAVVGGVPLLALPGRRVRGVAGWARPEPTLQHLAWFAAVVLAPSTGLETGGTRWGEQGEGETQGDPKASAFFAGAIHGPVRRFDAELSRGGGFARFGNDDGYGCGPANVVFPALARLEVALREECGLTLQRQKTEVFSWGELPPGTPGELRRAGSVVAGEFEPGFDCYGIPLGSDAYVGQALWEKGLQVKRDMEQVAATLSQDSQALLAPVLPVLPVVPVHQRPLPPLLHCTPPRRLVIYILYVPSYRVVPFNLSPFVGHK